jgi:hypothetical protein
MNRKRVFINIALTLIVSIFGGRLLSAQTSPSNGISVYTVVTVEPRHGATPSEIRQEDVMVREGKDRDTVTEWMPAQGDRAALEFFVLLDDGSNMTVGTQLDEIRKFILAQPDSTKVGVAYMQNGIARVIQNLTADHEQAAKALRLPLGQSGANGSPYFSVSDLAKRWPADNARHEMVMVSDGIDRYYTGTDYDDPYLDAAIDDAQRAGIVISAIYTPGVGHFGHSFYRTYWGQLYMAKLAEKTGGEAYDVGFNGPPVTFAPYLEDITHRLGNQYLLTFLAKPKKKAGLQSVKISTEVQSVDLVAPDKVFVPSAH